MKKNKHRPIRWSGVFFRFMHLIVLTFFVRLIQNWIGSLALSHETIIAEAVRLIYILIAIWLVIIPLLKEFGIEIDRSSQNREK